MANRMLVTDRSVWENNSVVRTIIRLFPLAPFKQFLSSLTVFWVNPVEPECWIRHVRFWIAAEYTLGFRRDGQFAGSQVMRPTTSVADTLSTQKGAFTTPQPQFR